MEEAVSYFQKAAAVGWVPAENYMGICYALGQGVARDKDKALEWFQKAIDAGDADAPVLMKELHLS